jgi:methyl-accepting chemotaxis protein
MTRLRSSQPPPLRFAVRVGGLLCLLALGVTAGSWLAFQQNRAILFRDLEERGAWTAQNLAHDAWYAIGNDDVRQLRDRITALFVQADIIYVGVAGRDGTLLFSSGSPALAQAGVIPALPSHSCQTAAPVVASVTLFETPALLISTPIVPLADLHAEAAGLAAQCVGTLHVGLALTRLDQRLFRILVTLASVCGAAVGLCALIYALLDRGILRPVSQSMALIQGVARGDFRDRADAISADAAHGAREDSVSAPPDSAAMLPLLHDFRARVRAWLARLDATSRDLTLTAADGEVNAAEALAVVERQTEAWTETTTALDRRGAAYESIAAAAAGVADAATESVDVARGIERKVAETVLTLGDFVEQTARNHARIAELGETFAQINAVVAMITTIADQTRMIAFNASIEAAGAGESGGRFAIVAAEVRRLARTVVESVDHIDDLITAIRAAASDLALASEASTRNAQQAITLVNEAGALARDMLTALTATTQTAGQIVSASRQVQDDHQAAAAQIAALREDVGALLTVGSQMLDLTRQIQQGTADLADVIGMPFTCQGSDRGTGQTGVSQSGTA